MGKIKGWKKIVDNSKRIEWVSKNSRIIFIDDITWFYITIKKKSDFKDFVEQTVPESFKTKAEALAYAMKYMRSHPGKNIDLFKYKTKKEAIYDLHVKQGGDYDEVIDYVEENWKNG